MNAIGDKMGLITIISEPFSEMYGGRKRIMICGICECGRNVKMMYSPHGCGYPKTCSWCKSLIFKDRIKAKKMRSSWAAMKRRCNDANGRHYKYYMANGITYCDRWEKFPAFYHDMQATWFLGAQLDRYPNTKGNYEPSNCRWATIQQQQRNKDSVQITEMDAEEIRALYKTGKYLQREIGDIYGISENSVSRIVNLKRWRN